MNYFYLTRNNASYIFVIKNVCNMKRLILLILLSHVLLIEAKQVNLKDGVDVYSVHSVTANSADYRSQSISADITGNTLTITFNDNVGIAHIIIKDSNGVYIDRENVFSTPDYATFFINDAGYYRMDITLSNGEQYYGYFRVEL